MIDVPYAVKRALKDGNRPKQYRFQVLNDDETVDFVIDNDTLVKESVKIDERMCSGDRLKFGLCEGASLEFQYFNHPNIRGRRVKVYLDVAYDNEGTEAYYPLSMGYFDVEQCSTQFSTGIIKAVAYNKLRSDYLDAKANDTIEDIISQGEDGYNTVSIYRILDELLEGYSISYQNNTETIGSALHPYTRTVWLYDSGGSNGYQYWEVYACQVWLTIYPYYPLPGYEDKYFKTILSFSELQEYISNIIDDKYIYKSSRGLQTMRFYAEHGDPNLGGSCFQENGDGQKIINIGPIVSAEPVIQQDKFHTNWPEGGPSINIIVPIEAFPTNERKEVNEIDPTGEKADAMGQRLVNWAVATFIENILSDAYDIRFGVDTVLPDVTLRELQSAVYETSALYGQLDRDTDLFYGVELNSGSLTPSASLYPSAILYPNNEHGNNIFRPFPSEYQKLWTDSVGEQTFRYLIITYKAIEYDQQGNPTEVDKTLQRTVHEHGTTNYNCSDNWLFRNLVWTAEQVGAYADAMVEKMRNIRWFPFEMWSTGLPYVEVGDAIEIADKEGDTHISYVLQRQLNGIQNLQDTYINGTLDIF